MASFADISIRFSANLKQFSSQLQNAERDLKKIGTQFKNAGAALSIGLTAPIVAFGAKGVFAFDQQAKALAQVEAGLKSTGNAANKTFAELQKGASDLQNTSLFGDEQILQDVTAQLLTFTNIAGTQFDRTQQAALDLATRLNGDLKSASIQLGKALNDPVANLSALSRSGIQFSEDQKKVINSLVKTGKLAEAQTIILDELEKQYGGAAKAAAAAGLGPFKQLSNQIGDLSEDFGKLIVEALVPFVSKIKDVVASLQGLSPETKKVIAVVAAFAASLGPVLIAVGYLATNVIPGLISAFAALKVAIAANPIGLLVTVVGALAATTLIANSRFRELTDATKEYASITATAAKNIAAEKVELEGLLRKAKDETASKESRLDAVKRLNEIVPEYNRQLTLETINTEKTTAATQRHVAALLNRAKVIAAQEKLVEVERELLELTLGTSDATDPTVYQNLKAAIVGLNNPVAAAIQQGRNLAENFNEEKTQLTALQKKLISFLGDNQSLVDQLNEQTATVTGLNAELGKPIERKVSTVLDPKLEISGVGIDASNEKLREQIAILESARKQYSETSAEYKYLSDQIAFHSTTIANSIKGIVGEGVQLKQFDEAAFNFEQKMNRIKEVAVAVGDTVGGAFESFTGRLVDSLNLADDGFQGFVKGLADTVTKLIAQMLAAALAQSISGATASGTATGPAAVFTTPAFIATAIGGILAAFAAIPKFAEGGLAYGPTLGLMGEYAGARNNPEVIAPLNKLKDLINPAGGGVELSLGSVIRGTDLQIVIERVVDRKLRFG